MTRRPRPLSRQRSTSRGTSDKISSSSKLKLTKRLTPSPIPGDDKGLEEEEHSGSGNSGSNKSGDSGYEADMMEDGDEGDMDAPRVAQWIDEDELEGGDEDEKEQGGKSSDLKTLQDDLSGLPFGALRTAQYMLSHAEVDSDKSDESESEHEEPEPVNGKGKEKTQPDWSFKPRKEIAKRTNKHAPIEITSKRPVTRKRIVVDVKTVQPRDPRFLPLAGEFSADNFQKSYGFLAESHVRELQMLREDLKRARKLLASSPRDAYDERASEVQRLELAVKRAESLVHKDRRDKIEQEALARMSREERGRRKQGKGEWHMKKADKRELLVKARYEALAADGGKRAVRKAIEKKQKKIGQKEKKSRPYGEKRRREGGDGGGEKRRRVG